MIETPELAITTAAALPGAALDIADVICRANERSVQ